VVLAAHAVLEAERRVSKAERKWLNSKYSNWEADYGEIWDQIIANVNSGDLDKTVAATLPALCNLTHLPLGTAFSRHEMTPHTSVYEGRVYHFDSHISKWCFDLDPARYAANPTVVDRFLSGEIQPTDLGGALRWMGLTPDVMGEDVYDYRWAADYAQPSAPAAETGSPS
jgi:YHS domain-containing protein